MREIKFRAWDFVNKIMDEDIFIDGAGNAYDYASTTYNTPNTEIQRCEFPVMQYTGQYDPTATEFCEGDIIKDHTDYWEVKFFDGAFWIVAIGGNAKPELLCGNDYMEIIGNRFENPELLEGNQ